MEDTLVILQEEGMITKTQARSALFRGYNEFYPYFYSQDNNVINNGPKEIVVLDVVDVITKESNAQDKD